jgi:beta-1,4-mannosyltransferase
MTAARDPIPDCSPALRVCFIPFYSDNPYQLELARALVPLGFHVFAQNGSKGLARLLFTRRGRPEVLHLHWLPPFRPTPLGVFRFLMFFARATALRLRGSRVVWTVHNLQDHDATWRWVELMFARLVVRLASGVIVHSPIAAQIVADEFGPGIRRKLAVVPHGNYIGVYPNVVPRAEARRRLGLPPQATVFLFLGYLRPYKGLNDLIRAFRQLDALDCVLLIAGSPFDGDTGAVDQLQAACAGDARILLRPGYVPSADIQLYMNAADAAVYPYQAILTSGAVVLGMSFGRACVAPRLGCIPDVLDPRGGVLYDRAHSDGLREALREVLRLRDGLPAMGAFNLKRSRDWDWDKIARQTADVYAQALGASPSLET